MKKSLTTLALILMAPFGFGFEIDGTKWPGGKTDFYVAIDGMAANGLLWNTAFIEAIDEWNQRTDFNFTLIEEASDPCGFDFRNGVEFTSDVCGSEYGENTLAVTIRRFNSQILGPPRITQSDIVINDSVTFDIFDGPLVQFGRPFVGVDFRRVALHELGHALGLEHEESLAAIMAPNIGNIDTLQEDDIQGANTLYGGLSNCIITPLQFGSTSNELNSPDCTVVDLTVGGTDTSFVDLYSFELDSLTTVQFDMSSPQLDSVLILANSDLEFLSFDDKTSNLCESTLTTTLQAGSYLLLGNTFVEPIKEECGNTGSYLLEASFSSSQLQPLGEVLSSSGAATTAAFAGGVSGDGGQSFGNKFQPSESLDISAQITVDAAHVGETGFIIAVAIVENQILFLNSSGAFVTPPAEGFIKADSRVLSGTEKLVLAANLVPAALGIDNIEVDFLVGYGVDSLPGEIFYHQQPINLVIAQ